MKRKEKRIQHVNWYMYTTLFSNNFILLSGLCVIDHIDFIRFTSRVILENTLWIIHHTRNDPFNIEDPRYIVKLINCFTITCKQVRHGLYNYHA